MKPVRDLMAWQERFYAQPCVYWVEQACGIVSERYWERTGNYYQTLEGAQKEKEWIESRGKRAVVVNVHLHSVALSTERWVYVVADSDPNPSRGFNEIGGGTSGESNQP